MGLLWKRSAQSEPTTGDLSACRETVLNDPHTSETGGANPLTLDDANLESPASRLEPEPDVEMVAALLSDRRSRLSGGIVSWFWVLAAPLLTACLAFYLVGGEPFGVVASIFALVTAGALDRRTRLLRQERAALQNSHLDNRWIGPLCEALEWPDRHVRGSAARLLSQFLPRLDGSQTELLNAEQLGCLYRRLATWAVRSDRELAFAILQALPFIGTEPALPFVERLAQRPAITRDGQRVRNAARATLALLERRVAIQRTQEEARKLEAEDTPATAPIAIEAEVSPEEREEMAAAAAIVDTQMRAFEADLRKLQTPGMRIGFLFAAWGVIIPYSIVQTIYQLGAHNWLGAMAFAVLGILTTQLHCLTLTEKHKLLARKLAKLDDVRCIGRLAEALEWPDPTVRNFVIAALTKLLPRVKASDAVLHTPRQRANLHRMLVLSNARQNAELLVAILEALQQIGDAGAVPYVEQLSNAQPNSARQARVCDAARDCLEYVRTRARLTQSSQSLLRASSATITGPESLLRAVSTSATDPEQLLRPDTTVSAN